MNFKALLAATAIALAPLAASAQMVPAGGFGDNILINPWMELDQANEGASITATRTAAGTFTQTKNTDGWSSTQAQSTTGSPTVVMQNVAVAPNGSVSDQKWAQNASIATTHADGTLVTLEQRIEPIRLAPLQYGTANAQTSTLQFCAKASVAGTYGFYIAGGANARTSDVAAENNAATAGSTYFHAFSIPTAADWSCYSFLIPGDTGGTWLVTSSTNAVDQTHGATLGFVLAINGVTTATYGVPTSTAADGVWFNLVSAGQGVIGNNATYAALDKVASATFELTGVKWSLNNTPLTHNPVLELQDAQRYYWKSCKVGIAGNSGSVCAQSGTTADVIGAVSNSQQVVAVANALVARLPVPMRIITKSATITTFDAQAANSSCFDITGGATQAVATVDTSSVGSFDEVVINCAASGVATAGNILGVALTVDARL